MSKPKRPDYNPSEWRPDRLRLACLIRGLETPAALRHLINKRRALRDEPPIAARTVERWLDGSVNPGMGRTGHESGVFELADVLQVSVDWLMGRVRREPSFSDEDRRRHVGHEGWLVNPRTVEAGGGL